MIPRFSPRLGLAELSAALVPDRGAVEHFEQGLAKMFNAVDAVAFPYGGSAQWAFFKEVGLEGADIHMPAYTCSVVAHAVSLSGNNPRFVDIQLSDYNMDLNQLADSITERTRAVIATNTFGYPEDVNILRQIVQDAERRYGHKVWFMQDCCHSFGAKWEDKFVGESGDVAVYAFNRQVYAETWLLSERTPWLDRHTKSYHLNDKNQLPMNANQLMIACEAAVGSKQLTLTRDYDWAEGLENLPQTVTGHER